MLNPYGSCLVVKRDDPTYPPDVISVKRIIIPETAKARAREATVLKVGPDTKEGIREGDRVLITWLHGTPYADKDMGDVEILFESEILAILEG